MDEHEASARCFQRLVKSYIAEPVDIHIITGAGGVGLRGTAGWNGTRWVIEMDKNIGDLWRWWRALWHEAAHIHLGDTPRRVDPNGAVDAQLIRGLKNDITEARADNWDRWRDDEKERRADEWGDTCARRLWPALVAHLHEMEERTWQH